MNHTPVRPGRLRGFTLIELSVVLVIVALLLGGILVGRSLLTAAALRSTIAQLEQYNTAVNTFRGKYGFMPGDIPDPYASNFGFKARGTLRGQGDGNDQLEGYYGLGAQSYVYASGETSLFWVDLSQAQLIPGNFTAASATVSSGTVTESTSPALKDYFPKAKIGNANYIYATGFRMSIGGLAVLIGSGGFGIAQISQIGNPSGCNGCMMSTPGIRVIDASNIDSKIDDGIGYSGRVNVMLLNPYPGWSPYANADPTTNCTDSGGRYLTQYNDGNGVNCALSFQFQ